MTAVTLTGFGAHARITHASNIDSITLRHMVDNVVTLNGMDAGKTGVVELAVFNSNFKTKFPVLNMDSIGGADFKTLDVSLANSEVTIQGTATARNIHLHSLGKDVNELSYSADPNDAHVRTVTIDGSADVNLFQWETDTFTGLRSFDASKAGGSVTTGFLSERLLSARGGSGDDAFDISAIGGTAANKAVISMGAGNDEVIFYPDIFNSSKMIANGGTGSDAALISGSGVDLGGLKNFETLGLYKGSGTYQLDAGWHSVLLLNEADNSSTVDLAGGSSLTTVVGSDFKDVVNVHNLAGSVGSKAQVVMAAGDDYLDVSALTLQATTQSFDGGDGTDHVSFAGNVSVIGNLFHNFERFHISGATGQYDFTGSGVDNVTLESPASGAAVLNGLSSHIALVVTDDQTKQFTLNIENAIADHFDMVNVLLADANVFGNLFAGLTAAGLSELQIGNNGGNPATLYLTAVGSVGDAAKIEIYGPSAVSLVASVGSTSYIKEIDVSNTGGVDMLGINDGQKALLSTGVVISGGTGNDKLVGGDGADTISSGGGDNIIEGSLGVDSISVAGGALDTLVFHSQDHSAYGSGDNVSGFNIFDGIDISDIVSSVTFGGDVATFAAGVATLSASHSVGFYDTANHTLYVDINHDGAIDAAHDMEFHLTGLSSFGSTSLIG
jgi:hypothetical protein